MAEKFIVLVTGTATMTTEEIWPNGDAPPRPTAKDVADVMLDEGKQAVLLDWNLIEDLDVEIYAGSTYAIPFRGDKRTEVPA